MAKNVLDIFVQFINLKYAIKIVLGIHQLMTIIAKIEKNIIEKISHSLSSFYLILQAAI